MKEILVTSSRPFENGGKMLGVGGKYSVSDADAKRLVNSGKAKVTKDLGQDAPTMETYEQSQARTQFLGMVRENASAIIAILKDEQDIVRVDEKENEEDAETSDADIELLNQTEQPKTVTDAVESVAGDRSEGLVGNKEVATSVDVHGLANFSETVNSEGSESTKNADGGEAKEHLSLTPLPDKFPGKDKLEAVGINNVEQIPTSEEELMKVEGMTERTAKAIGVKLQQIQEEGK